MSLGLSLFPVLVTQHSCDFSPVLAQNSVVTDNMIACDHALSLYLCNLFSEGGHDTILSQITCKKARI